MSEVNKEYKVLFLTSQYAPIPKVCEICVKRVREALFTQGIKSDVLQFTGEEGLVEELAVGNVYSVGAGEGKFNATVTNRFINLLRKASISYRWPLCYSYDMNKRFKQWVTKLNNQNRYDAIIGMALPVDTAVAGVGLENFIFYELDAISNNPRNSGFVKGLLKYRVNRVEKAVFEAAALIIHMEFNKSYFNKEKFARYRRKSVFSDIPNLQPFLQVEVKKKSDIICAYFGALVRDIRNPEYLLNLFEAIKDEINITCEFYSRGNCEDILEDAERRNPDLIKVNGYVSQDIVVERQNRADILLSIGNKLTGEDCSLPSKIIEYISIGKPIIHIHGGKNDSAISYLKQYGLSLIIDPEDDFTENSRKVTKFIGENRGKSVSFSDVKEKFYHNSPEYTAEIIHNFINRK